MSTATNNQQIVIYGGGMAGAILAKKLSDGFEVTLVDPNDYFEVPMATPRSLVTPEFSEQAIIPFAQALPKVRLVRGTLTEFDGRSGTIKHNDGKQMHLQGDVTVLATGSSFSNALMRATDATFSERKAFFAKFQQRIEQAQRILIVGGGPIGVEVAGEITDKHSNKSVTLLESGPRILAGTSDEASGHAASVLKARGIEILCNERLQNAGSTKTEVFGGAGEARTSSGRTIPYDLIIWCIGGKPNTDYMKPLLASLLDEAERIRVTPQLRVEGMQSVFALGDITDLAENKMAWHIADQVKNAAFNIRQVLAGKTSNTDLKIHKPQTGNPMMAVSIGRHTGVLHLPVLGVVRSAWMNRKAKAEHMLVPKYRKILGV
jgi:NADH dehydrogenase FAD-containing subunit